MALTKAQMRNKVLRVLGKLPENQVAPAWSSELVEGAIDQAQAFLEAEGLAYWETSAIPDGVAHGYSYFVAGRVAPELLGEDQAARYTVLAPEGLAEMRRFCALGNADVRAVYY